MCYWCIIACYTFLGKATLCGIWVCLSPFDEVVTHLNTVGQSSTSSVPILKWRVRWLSFSISSCWPVVAMYQWYQIMICLLKFDFFAFTGVTMQVAPYNPSAWCISLDASISDSSWLLSCHKIPLNLVLPLLLYLSCYFFSFYVGLPSSEKSNGKLFVHLPTLLSYCLPGWCRSPLSWCWLH